MSSSRPNVLHTAVPKSKLVLRSYATINTRPVEWGWRNAFPRRMLSVIVGDPGLGKSLITCDLAARFTRGDPMPCGGVNGFGEPVNVLILAIEDNPDNMIKPRLELAGADMTRVFDIETYEAGSPNARALPQFPRDVAEISALVHEQNIRVIIVDPVTAHMEQNQWINADVRRALNPLAALADEYDVVVILVMHLNKSESASFLNRVAESKAFVAVPRTVWALTPDPEDGEHHVLVALKSNIGPKSASYGFGIHSEGPESPEPPRVLWDEAPGRIRMEDVENAFRMVQSGDAPATSSRADAVWLLTRVLRDGEPVESERIRAFAEVEGMTLRTLQRHAESMGVKFERTPTVPSKGTWRWPRT